MYLRPGCPEHIGRPVPAIGRLQRHLGIRAGLRQRHTQCHRVIVDADALERLASLVHTHDH
jgi:hypothetical protein